ncbi:MAG: hypothetical protein IPM54_30420 [Polyangiaceae bacterium]|nr:hypothetical protein [Polyangiaceae bacterium]
MPNSPDTSPLHFTPSTLERASFDAVNVPRDPIVPLGQTTHETSQVTRGQTSSRPAAYLRRAAIASLLVAPLVAIPPVARVLVDRAAPALADVATTNLDSAFAWRPVEARPVAPPKAPAKASDSVAETRRSDAPSTRHAAPSAKTHRGIIVRTDAVVRAVRSGGRPSSVPAPATAQRPAGLSLVGVSAFGTGLRDGDILTSVGGAPATSESAVIGIVAGAISRNAKVITGVVWRGEQRFDVAVEIPRPKDFSDKPRRRASVRE